MSKRALLLLTVGLLLLAGAVAVHAWQRPDAPSSSINGKCQSTQPDCLSGIDGVPQQPGIAGTCAQGVPDCNDAQLGNEDNLTQPED